MSASVFCARALALALAVLVSCPSRPAFAEIAAERIVLADRLFEDGMRLYREGHLPAACDKLKESLEIDPEAMGTQFYLASCYERLGRSATAWALFDTVAGKARAAGNQTREDEARSRADELAPKLCRLRLRFSEKARSVVGLVVKRDGVVLPRAGWEIAVPVDPGAHDVALEAPSATPWKQRVVVSLAGVTVELDVEAPAAVPASRPRHTAAIVLGGAGVVSVAAGVTLGVLAGARWSDAEAQCPTRRGCSASAVDEQERALLFAHASTVGFVVGGAAAGAALVLFLTDDEPSTTDASVTLSPLATQRGAGAQVVGTF